MVCLCLAFTGLMLAPSAASARPNVSGNEGGFGVSDVLASQEKADQHGALEFPEEEVPAAAPPESPNRDYRVSTSRPACSGYVPSSWAGGPEDPAQQLIQQICMDPVPPDPAAPAAAPAPPQITRAMVRRAFEQVPVPELSSQTQPVDKTLVNFDTIFYVDAQPMTETVTLLGQQVTLFIEPSTYRWDHGDGSEVTTYSPGAAYPSKEIVHRYMKARQTVRHQVSIDWTATYSVNGGPPQPVPGTVTTVGPETPLRISEAAPALSGDHSG